MRHRNPRYGVRVVWRVEGPYAPRSSGWQGILVQGSALLQQPKPRENEFRPRIPAVLRRNFSLFPLPRAHTSLARLPPSSFLRAPTYGVDGMECPSHWPERHSLRWHCLPDWLATPDPPLPPAYPSARVAPLPRPQLCPEPPPSLAPSALPAPLHLAGAGTRPARWPRPQGARLYKYSCAPGRARAGRRRGCESVPGAGKPRVWGSAAATGL